MIVTTSRKPSQRTRSFCKRFAKCIGAEYITRGKLSLEEIFSLDDKIIYITELKGNPGKIIIFDKGKEVLKINIKGVSLEYDKRKSRNRNRG